MREEAAFRSPRLSPSPSANVWLQLPVICVKPLNKLELCIKEKKKKERGGCSKRLSPQPPHHSDNVPSPSTTQDPFSFVTLLVFTLFPGLLFSKGF